MPIEFLRAHFSAASMLLIDSQHIKAPRTDPVRIQHRPCDEPGPATTWGIWRPFRASGCLLGASGCLLWVSGGLLGVSGSLLEASGGLLGASGGFLGAPGGLLEASVGHHWASRG